MSAADRLEAALLDAAESLMEVVGLPADSADPNGERIPVSGSVVDRGSVPESAYRAAVFALDVLSVGYGIMDPESSAMSVEDGLAMLTEGGGDA